MRFRGQQVIIDCLNTVECIEELWMDLTRQEGEYFLGMNLEEEDLFLSFLSLLFLLEDDAFSNER